MNNRKSILHFSSTKSSPFCDELGPQCTQTWKQTDNLSCTLAAFSWSDKLRSRFDLPRRTVVRVRVRLISALSALSIVIKHDAAVLLLSVHYLFVSVCGCIEARQRAASPDKGSQPIHTHTLISEPKRAGYHCRSPVGLATW